MLGGEVGAVGAEAARGGEGALPAASLASFGRASQEKLDPFANERGHRDAPFGSQSLELPHLGVGELDLSPEPMIANRPVGGAQPGCIQLGTSASTAGSCIVAPGP